MGVARRRRQEKPGRARPAVAIPSVVWRRIERLLDEDIKARIKREEERDERNRGRLARGLKPLKPLTRAHVLPQRGVRSPDRALRATIGEALACLRAAPVVLEGLYLDPNDERPVPDATIQATWRTLAMKARMLATIGAPFMLRRGKATLLERAMVRHVLMPDHPEIAHDPSQPLTPAVLELIAERAEQKAASYRGRGGEHRNLAREHFRWNVARAIEARCGEGSARLGFVYEHDWYRGLLFNVLWELRPWLPGLADATKKQLYDAFTQARRKRRKRSTRGAGS
jgi:hypothetical protein